MGQQEVLDILKKAKKPLSRTEIAEQLLLSEIQKQSIKISMILKRMLKYDEVKCIEINRHQAMKHYGCKRRMRVYYVG